MSKVNPCKDCIVTSMCLDVCDKFVFYLNSHLWVRESMVRILDRYPTTFKEIATYCRKKEIDTEDMLVYNLLYRLKKEMIEKGII